MTTHEIAKVLLKNKANANMLAVAQQEQSYKDLEAMLNGTTMKGIGQAVGRYVKKHEMIWALIDVAQGKSPTTTVSLAGLTPA